MTDSPTSQAMHLAMTELRERELRISQLEEELAKERADAGRYRWLRRNVVRMEDYAFSVGEDVEAYVDAMIAQRLDEGIEL